MVGRDADVRGALLDHLQHGVQHAHDRAERSVDSLVETARAVEVPEQLVRAVDEMNGQSLFRWMSWRAMMMRCISLVPSPMQSSGASR